MDIDIFVDRDTHFRITTGETRRRIQCAPGLRFGRVAHFDHAVRLSAAADLIMQSDIDHRRIAAVVAQKF